jgi:hypothetical protein
LSGSSGQSWLNHRSWAASKRTDPDPNCPSNPQNAHCRSHASGVEAAHVGATGRQHRLSAPFGHGTAGIAPSSTVEQERSRRLSDSVGDRTCHTLRPAHFLRTHGHPREVASEPPRAVVIHRERQPTSSGPLVYHPRTTHTHLRSLHPLGVVVRGERDSATLLRRLPKSAPPSLFRPGGAELLHPCAGEIRTFPAWVKETTSYQLRNGAGASASETEKAARFWVTHSPSRSGMHDAVLRASHARRRSPQVSVPVPTLERYSDPDLRWRRAKLPQPTVERVAEAPARSPRSGPCVSLLATYYRPGPSGRARPKLSEPPPLKPMDTVRCPKAAATSRLRPAPG